MRKTVSVTVSALVIIFAANAASLHTATPSTIMDSRSSHARLLQQSYHKWVFNPAVARVSRAALLPPGPPPPPAPPTALEALQEGVLIVVSLPSQQAFVFKKGNLWDATPVSTGKPGNETPTGAFPILQKKVDHRSTLYDDAPMPFMQRLTWDGVALHAGSVPGYAASHGCIRLPKTFAKKLYEITNFSSTVVVVTEGPVTSAKEARSLV